MGVGVGEAALSPAAYSMIADLFPKKDLGRALAFYSIGSFIGGGLAYLIGGAIVSLLQAIKLHVVLRNELSGSYLHQTISPLHFP